MRTAINPDQPTTLGIDSANGKLPSNRRRMLIAVPMLIALSISVYLTWVSLTASHVVGCGGGSIFNCNHVIYSKWSKLFGTPVAAMASLTYIGMSAALIVTGMKRFSERTRAMAWTAVAGLSMAAAMAACYFIFLQVFVLHHLCSWCLAAHTCGLIVAVVALSAHRFNQSHLQIAGGMAAFGLAVMIIGQVTAEPPKTFEIITHTAVVPDDRSAAAVGAYVGGGDSDPADDDNLFAAPGEDDVFEAPADDVFEAPADDVFEAPADDVFEAPSEDREPSIESAEPTDAETLLILPRGNGVPESDTAASGLPTESNDSHFESVRSNLLAVGMLLSPRLWMANDVLLIQTDEGDGSGTKSGGSGTKSEAAAEPASDTPTPRIVSFSGGATKLDAAKWPIAGSPDAKHVFVEMFDYTCPHCRSTYSAIEGAKQKLGDDLAVLVLPVPLNSQCNKTITRNDPAHAESCDLAKLAIAVWKVDAEKFETFHDWMFEGEVAPTYEVARSKASELVGAAELDEVLAKSICSQFIDSHVKLYKRAGGGEIPKLLFPGTSVVGEFTSVDQLLKIIDEQCR